MTFLENYDVAVVGAGHAGVEAALAAARLGLRTAIFTISLDSIANMPCHLGGQMAKAADATFLQSRVLNLGKGPAVHSHRVQADRVKYHTYRKKILESEPLLDIRQGEVTRILTDGDGGVCGVETRLGSRFGARAAIICTGTYLKGVVHPTPPCPRTGFRQVCASWG